MSGDNDQVIIPNLSVIIIAKNEERVIGDCLRSVDFAGEIIVVDSDSSDRTPEICQVFPQVKFFSRKMEKGFGEQKNYALSLATKDWVFSIDADEAVTDELREEIKACLSSPSADGFRVRRRNFVFGRWLDDYKPLLVRLFRRDKGSFTSKKVDEAVIVQGAVKDLNGFLLHRSRGHSSVGNYYRLVVHERSVATALDLYAMGRRISVWNAVPIFVLRPVAIFFQKLILKRGYSYGWRGVILAFTSSCAYVAAYARLAQMKDGT